MNKHLIIDLMTEKYSSFTEYVDTLTDEEYFYSRPQKWTAGQHMEHIVLCVKPLLHVFSMEKQAIAQNFGRTDKAGRSYDILLDDYIAKLKEGGKAPERFLPVSSGQNRNEEHSVKLLLLIKDLCSKIETFSDDELDGLIIPHPLLGELSLREMLYNTLYHVEHHQTQVAENLRYKIIGTT